MDISPLSQAPPDLAPFEDTYRFAAFTVIRFAGFTAHALLFGIAAVTLLVLRPTFASLGSERWEPARRRLARRLEGFVQSALVSSAVVTLTAIVLQAVLVAEAQGGDVTLDAFTSTFSTPFGRWHFLRFPLLVALAVLLTGRVASAALAGAGDQRRGRTGWWVGWLVLSGALLATSTLSGHSVVATPRAVAIANDLIHLIAGAVWFAGIVILAVVLPDAWRTSGEDRLRILAPSVVRFSTVAAVSVAVLAITGTLNSFLHVGAFNDLVDSGYGRTLALKVLLFGAILGLGGVNHYVIRRRLSAALESDDPATERGSANVFRRTIAAELVLGLMLMVMTGMLVGLARTKEVTSETSSQSGVTSAPKP